MEINQVLTSAFLVTWLAAAINLASPVLLASLGEIYDELSGVLNIGIEGTILLGALASYLGSYFLGSAWLGLLVGLVVGILFNFLLAWLYVDVGANQVVVGIIFNTLALGVVSYVYRIVMGIQTTPQKVAMIPTLNIPSLASIPLIGPIIFSQNVLVYVTLLFVAVSGFVLYKTKFGLKLRAVGEHPRAADTAGIAVKKIRYIGVLLSGAFAGLAGGFLVLGQLGIFRDNIVSGRGFIALAIVIFGRWNPYKATLAALIFGAADALQLSLQIFSLNIPSQVLVSLPYVLTIIAMSGILGKVISPSALMLHYKKE